MEFTQSEKKTTGEEDGLVCLPCDSMAPTQSIMEQKEEDADEDMERVLAPVDRIVLPIDVIDFTDEDEVVCVIGTRSGKVTRISGLSGMKNLTELVLRSCLLSTMEGIDDLIALKKLELYDNHIERISSIEKLANLTILDISFNAIRDMSPVAYCSALEELYIAQNKLRKIEGLGSMTRLRVLDLGANRIRSMEGVENLTRLESLWLGKNKIEELTCVSSLVNLRQLDVQNNRLSDLGDVLGPLVNLQELYLACNKIISVQGLPSPSVLNTLDLSSNGTFHLEGIENQSELEELWMTKSGIQSYDQLEPLRLLRSLSCLYLEHSPIANDNDYKSRVISLLPSLTQLDANLL